MDERERQRERWSEPAFADDPYEQAARRPIEHQCVEFCPICRTADVLRATLPPEFQEHWQSWQRELLMAVRSLVDHYIEHLDRERKGGVRIEDIPIE
jgi:hypothetical protein